MKKFPKTILGTISAVAVNVVVVYSAISLGQHIGAKLAKRRSSRNLIGSNPEFDRAHVLALTIQHHARGSFNIPKSQAYRAMQTCLADLRTIEFFARGRNDHSEMITEFLKVSEENVKHFADTLSFEELCGATSSEPAVIPISVGRN